MSSQRRGEGDTANAVMGRHAERMKFLEPGAGACPAQTTTTTTTFSSLLGTSKWGLGEITVETNGITPIPVELRTDRRLYQLFFTLFSANLVIGNFSVGTLGPSFFKLGFREAALVLFGVDALVSAIPAYFTVFGPKLGMRAMVQARYSWGYYGASLPSILNVLTMQGYLVVNTIVGGQLLAKVSGHLNATLGIVIIAGISLLLSFCGYRIMHWYESIAWIPTVLAYIVMLGVGAKNLKLTTRTPNSPTSAILSFAGTVGGGLVSWCTMTPDYGVYHDATTPSIKIFAYVYFGIFSGNIISHIIGAAFGATAPSIPSWYEGIGGESGSDVGGLFSAILEPTGGFGKFLLVIVALAVPSICAPTMYTFGTSFMAVSSISAKIPRYWFAMISTAILIPVSIIGATRFYATLVAALAIIGYWSSPFAAIILVEHFLFRSGDFRKYSVEDWNSSQQPLGVPAISSSPYGLPTGCAAVLAFFMAIGIVVPCMEQQWFVGPISALTGCGDIGAIVGFVSAGIFFGILRAVEKCLSPKMS